MTGSGRSSPAPSTSRRWPPTRASQKNQRARGQPRGARSHAGGDHRRLRPRATAEAARGGGRPRHAGQYGGPGDERPADRRAGHRSSGSMHPKLGEIPVVGTPLQFSRMDPGVRRAAPLRGEHTDAVLAECGLSPERIRELRDKKRHSLTEDPPCSDERRTAFPRRRRRSPDGRRACPFPSSTSSTGPVSSRPSPTASSSACSASGCFWGAERKFWEAKGVYSTSVGYAGGSTPEPDLRRGLQRRDRAHGSRAGGLRPARDQLRRLLEDLLGEPRPDAGHAPGQ